MGSYERLLWRWLFRLAPAALVVLSIYHREWGDLVPLWYVWGVVIRASRVLAGEVPNKTAPGTILVPFFEPLALASSLTRKAVSRVVRQLVRIDQN